MPIERDDESERQYRIDWLIEETRTRCEDVREHVDKVTVRVRRASKMAKANLAAAKRKNAPRP